MVSSPFHSYEILLIKLSLLIPGYCSVYCSLIMLTLFSSSCYWSDRCFLDSNNGHWFEPRFLSSAAGTVFNAAAGAVGAGGGAAIQAGVGGAAQVWTGIGLDWLRTAVGRREWRLPCVDVNIRL